jgi:DnaK suppressor protein
MGNDRTSFAIRPNEDADLSDTQLEALADALIAKRDELRDRIRSLEDQLIIKGDCSVTDAVDAAGLQERRLQAHGMIEQHKGLIAEIDAAIARLRNGQYGVSEATGEPISFQRLRVVPWART